mgnify:FL=1
MVSRNDIFEIADRFPIAEGWDWQEEILKYFSTDELKDFFDDFARLRNIDIDWTNLDIKMDDE